MNYILGMLLLEQSIKFILLYMLLFGKLSIKPSFSLLVDKTYILIHPNNKKNNMN